MAWITPLWQSSSAGAWVGLGNAPSTIPVVEALRARREHPSALVREHVEWALARHQPA